MAKRALQDSSSDQENDTIECARVKHVSASSPSAPRQRLIQCELPPHNPASFASYDEYDAHYRASHMNRCTECQKNLPTSHFLDLHIAENHDPLTAARKARGDRTYCCFVEDCDRVCSTWQKRRMHLVDKHGFPRNYDFFIVNDGIDRRKSMLRIDRQHRKHGSMHSAAQSHDKDVGAKPSNKLEGSVRGNPSQRIDASSDEDNDSESTSGHDHPVTLSSSTSAGSQGPMTPLSGSSKEDVDSLTKSMSALKFVPPSVRFGRGRGRGGLARR